METARLIRSKIRSAAAASTATMMPRVSDATRV